MMWWDSNEIVWRDPDMFYLALIPLAVWLAFKVLQRNDLTYADRHLHLWALVTNNSSLVQRIFSKSTWYMLAWIFFAIAAAGPRQSIETDAQQNTKLDMMLIIDVSRSMHAADIFPSRLQRAQIEIEELLERAKGTRVGIIVFAGRPHVFVPLTADHDALRFYLNSLNNLTLPTFGSAVGSALELARSELINRTNSVNPGAIILLSDGDFSTESESLSVTPSAKDAVANNIPVYVLGIGQVDGEAIQLENGKWLEYENQSVVTALNQTVLQKIANASGSAHYSLVQDDAKDWELLYDKGILSQIVKSTDIKENEKILWQQFYHLPLFLAILFLWLGLIPYRFRLKSGYSMQVIRHFRPQQFVALNATVLALAIVLLNIFPPTDSFAKNHEQMKAILDVEDFSHSQAYKYYIAHQFADALRHYQKLSGYDARYGEGSSHYQIKKYNAAIRQFSRAVILAGNNSDRASALYNLGNSYFKVGDYTAAITVYQDVFRYMPKHAYSRHNLEFSQALKEAVDQRVAADDRKARASDRPQLGRDELLETRSDKSISVNESSDTGKTIRFSSKFTVNSSANFERLIQQGLLQIRLAAGNDMSDQLSSHESDHYQPNKLDFINARIRMAELDQQQDLLWKRIFELEEGFPALLDEPQQIPGVRPW